MSDNLQQLFDFFEENEFEQSDKTIKNWMDSVKRLTKEYPEEDKLKVFDDYDYIVNVANNIESISSKQKFVSNISQVIKYYGDIDVSDETKNKLSKFNIETSSKHTESRAMHNTPKETYIDWLKLYKLFDCYPENSIEYLFLATTLLIPPRRTDWAHAIFVKEKPDILDSQKNYVILHDDNTVELLFLNTPKMNNYINSWNKILNNSNFTYIDSCPLFNPNKLAQLLINSYNSNPRERVFVYNTISPKVYKNNKLNFDLNVDNIRHSFANYIWINNSKMQNYYINLITIDIAEKNPMTFRSYSTLGQGEKIEDDKVNEENKYIKHIINKKNVFESENEIIQKKIKELQENYKNNLNSISIFNGIINEFEML